MVSRHRILLDSHAPLISDFWTWISIIAKDDGAFLGFDVAAWDLVEGALTPDLVAVPAGRRHERGMTWPDRRVLVELVVRMTAIRSIRWRVDEQRVLPVDTGWIERLEERHVYNFHCEMSIGDGWSDLIQSFVDLAGMPLPIFSQIKEKFGMLRAYSDGAITPLADALVTAAEFISGTICEDCGRPGRRRQRTWVATLCDEHSKVRLR